MSGDSEEMIHHCHSVWAIGNFYNSVLRWRLSLLLDCTDETAVSHSIHYQSYLFCLLRYALLLFNYHVNTVLYCITIGLSMSVFREAIKNIDSYVDVKMVS